MLVGIINSYSLIIKYVGMFVRYLDVIEVYYFRTHGKKQFQKRTLSSGIL
jgi:hypothetical protein